MAAERCGAARSAPRAPAHTAHGGPRRERWDPARLWRVRSAGNSQPYLSIWTLSGNIALSLERVLYQNSILAFRAGGKQRDRTTDQFLDPPDVFYGLRRQIRPGTGVGGRLLPTLDCLINRLHPRLRAFPRRQIVDFAAVQPVA